MKTVEITIKNLLLRTIIGFNEWERKKQQDVIINATIEFDRKPAVDTDNVIESVNYKTITKRIIEEVENSNFNLLEKLADHILNIIMDNEKVVAATVEIDKPHSVRFSESVSAKVSATRQ